MWMPLNSHHPSKQCCGPSSSPPHFWLHVAHLWCFPVSKTTCSVSEAFIVGSRVCQSQFTSCPWVSKHNLICLHWCCTRNVKINAAPRPSMQLTSHIHIENVTALQVREKDWKKYLRVISYSFKSVVNVNIFIFSVQNLTLKAYQLFIFHK